MVPTARLMPPRLSHMSDQHVAKTVLTDTVSWSHPARVQIVSVEPEQECVVFVSPLELLMRVIDRSWRNRRLSPADTPRSIEPPVDFSVNTCPGCRPCSCSTTSEPRAEHCEPRAGLHARRRTLCRVAAKGGHPTNPAWYYNLRANKRDCPDSTRRFECRPAKLILRNAERYGPKRSPTRAHWRRYARRVPASRTIPLIALERVRATSGP